jgi:hypothetical protein
MPSSYPRKTFSPRRLLHTLSSFLDSLWARLTSLPAMLSRAWRNLKFKKTKSTVNEVEASNQANQPKPAEQSLLTSGDTMRRDVPESACQTQTQNPSNTRKYGQYVVWPFVAVWRCIVWLFLKADKHNGGITALATVAIVALTVFYVGYSKKQWQTMQQQLSDSRAVQAARLIVDIPEAPIIVEQQNGEYLRAKGKIVIKNVGGTAALDPSYEKTSAGGIYVPKGCGHEEFKATPDPRNSPIAVSTPVELPFDLFLGKKTDLLANKWFGLMVIKVAYRDVYGTSYSFDACFVYDSGSRGFYRQW